MAMTVTKGLSSAEAHQLLLRNGNNSVVTHHRLRPVKLMLNKISSPLSLILIATALLSYILGQGSNALIIILMVLVSAVLDFANSYRSQKAVEELEAKVATEVTVRRDGREIELPTQLLVPGDIVLLSAGDVVPADGVIIEAKDLYVNQSVLTGESFPIEKSPVSSSVGQIVSARNPHAAMMGCSIVSGLATLAVTATGQQSELGRLSLHLSNQPPESDFEKGIKKFSYFTVLITTVLVIFVFVANAAFGRGALESFLFAIAIAIGLTPELLPVILSVSLARGSVELSRKDVVVRHLSSIENLGNMTVLATDKTGTLTENRIVLVEWIDLSHEKSKVVLRLAAIASHFHSGVANPLDEAVIRLAKERLSGIEKIDEIPFDFERRRSSVVVKEGKVSTLISRGAPEAVFAAVTQYRQKDVIHHFDDKAKKLASDQFVQLSQEGYRVLAVASKVVSSQRNYDKGDEVGLVLEGFVAFLDPPKASVGAAIQELEALGVTVKIMTGDHELLAEKICREVGLDIGKILTGEQVGRLTDEELIAVVNQTTIFARVDPEQKERLVLALKKAGAVVGFLGDGINDAPALKAADVGISVNNAVSVAKDSADIILLKKSLHVLKDGVVMGRKIFQNTMKYILMGLSSNFGNVVSMAGASVILPFLPMLPAQILLNNFLYDMSQLSLSTDNVDQGATVRPLKWDFRLIRRYMIMFGVVSSLFDFLTFFVLRHYFHLDASHFQTAWFIESLTTQGLVIFLIRTRQLPFIQSRPSWPVFVNVVLVVTLAWAIPFTALGRSFQFTALAQGIVFSIGVIVVLYLLSTELTKRIFFRFNKV